MLCFITHPINILMSLLPQDELRIISSTKDHIAKLNPSQWYPIRIHISRGRLMTAVQRTNHKSEVLLRFAVIPRGFQLSSADQEL